MVAPALTVPRNPSEGLTIPRVVVTPSPPSGRDGRATSFWSCLPLLGRRRDVPRERRSPHVRGTERSDAKCPRGDESHGPVTWGWCTTEH